MNGSEIKKAIKTNPNSYVSKALRSVAWVSVRGVRLLKVSYDATGFSDIGAAILRGSIFSTLQAECQIYKHEVIFEQIGLTEEEYAKVRRILDPRFDSI